MTGSGEVDLLVRGDLVLPSGVLKEGSLAVIDGKVAGIFGDGASLRARREIDASGQYVLPGLVDSHVHTLSAPQEGITSATAAAAAGGVTTIIDMPYDAGRPVTTRERLREKIIEVGEQAHVDVGLYGTIAKVDGVRAIPDLVSEGVLGFKFSLFETDPARFPRISDGDLEEAFSTLAKEQIPIVLHAELQEIIERRTSLNRGQNDPKVHGRNRPIVAETAAIAKALELATWTGARLHIAHVSHPRGFQLIDWYRSRGAQVSGETCVHYLALTEDDVVALGPIAKVNPPIRDREAHERLWEELAAGRIFSISTDHAPWPLKSKERPMPEAHSGMPGLQTLLPVLHTEFSRRGVSIDRLVHLSATAPAELFGLGERKGKITVGHDADFVIFDPTTERRFDASRSFSSAKWSPFEGRTLRGSVRRTFVRGQEVFDGEQVTSEPGFGEWLRR